VSNKRPWTIDELTEMVDQGRILERLRVLQILEEIAQEFSRKDELERYVAKVKKVLNERA
jgi:hypothetical protein